MKLHPLLFILTLGAGSSAWADKPIGPLSPLRAFDSLVGNWQCQAQQMHIGLDRFALEYIDAAVRLEVARADGSENINASMHAMSMTQESLFQSAGLITYDPQRAMFVQYETTEGGSEATLYTPGFAGPCVTWRYAPHIEAVKAAATQQIAIEATYCLAEENQALHIDYTLHLAEHDPFVLFTASCDREASEG